MNFHAYYTLTVLGNLAESEMEVETVPAINPADMEMETSFQPAPVTVEQLSIVSQTPRPVNANTIEAPPPVDILATGVEGSRSVAFPQCTQPEPENSSPSVTDIHTKVVHTRIRLQRRLLRLTSTVCPRVLGQGTTWFRSSQC